MQAIYEVRLILEPEIESEYLEWLKPHMEFVVKVGGFVKANLYREESATNEKVWVSHYLARDVKDIHKYIAEKSAETRADALTRFASKFRAERRILVPAT